MWEYGGMRIAIVTDACTPQQNGVATTYRYTEEELKAMGHQVLMVHPLMFWHMPMPFYQSIPLALPGTKVAQLLDEFRPDAIHVATEGTLGWAALFYCHEKKMPFTTTYHTRHPQFIEHMLGIPSDLTMRVVRYFHSYAARTMVATEALRKEMEEAGLSNLCVWTRGVDHRLFDPAQRASLPGKGPAYLYVGRISVEKNIEAFLELDLEGTKYVVGDGPQLEVLREKYPEAHFTGRLHGKELARHYASADVFVFPSRSDTFGNVMLEAISCGTPVAAYPVRGPLDIVKEGVNGSMHEDLKEAVLRAREVPRESCIAEARRYTWRAATQQFVSNLAPIAKLPEEDLYAYCKKPI